MHKKLEINFQGRSLSIEVGRVARQASGAALVRSGDTMVLATAVSTSPRTGIDFFPLTVDFQEKTFAAGKIPGGFFKREGRPPESAVLTSRLIDRPLRPLFPNGFTCETQVIATLLSLDPENDADTLALIGASAALHVSDIPFLGPVAAVRVGRVDGKLVVNPSQADLEQSDLSLVVAGTCDGIVMVEGGAKILPEDVMLDALYLAHDEMQPVLALQEELRRAVGKPKREVLPVEVNADLVRRVKELTEAELQAALRISVKQDRAAALKDVEAKTVAALGEEFPEAENQVRAAIADLQKHLVRKDIVADRRRIDGRGLTDVRPISCEVEVLPRTHGSALFTRGETQALVVATLGTTSDEQKIDALLGEHYKKFMLHYNFPPFSVGEARFLRSPGRREVGHGALAERALSAVLPDGEQFPYTIRVVSEILESNGSSSMATVCGGSLAMMDAGVPLRAPVAGIAMGLIKEGDEFGVLSDILGDEDHLGDMDFKVAGTSEGVTALQMDIKIAGVTREIMRDALYQARDGRLHILETMNRALGTSRETLSPYAPRIVTLKIRPDKIRDLIGPGGKVIRGIVDETGAKIDVENDGTVLVASNDGESMKRAVQLVESVTAEPELGKVYKGKVRKIMDFGAFVEIMPGTDGLLHISQISRERVRQVTDVLQEGDEVSVKVLDIDKSGKIRLSRKEAMEESGGGRQASTGPRRRHS